MAAVLTCTAQPTLHFSAKSRLPSHSSCTPQKRTAACQGMLQMTVLLSC